MYENFHFANCVNVCTYVYTSIMQMYMSIYQRCRHDATHVSFTRVSGPWPTTERDVTVRNLKPDTRYHVRVRAFNAFGKAAGSFSPITSLTTRTGESIASQAKSP